MKYDLIVVGGGPGGLMAAKTAAEDGLKVILVERKRNITEINRACSQIFYIRKISPSGDSETGKTRSDGYIEPVSVEMLTDKTKFHFQKPGFSVDYTGCLRPYLNWIHVSPNGHQVNRYKTNERPWGFYYNKETFVADLLVEVEKAGAEVWPATLGISAENTEEGVRVRIQRKAREEVIEARAAVAADGLTSKIADSLGFTSKRKALGPARGGGFVQYVLEGVEAGFPLSSYLTWTIPSINPYGFISIGLSEENRHKLATMTAGGLNPNTILETFMKHPKYAHMFKNARILKKESHGRRRIMLSPITEPVAGNVVIVGDAGAIAETWTQGAVACGYQAVKAIEKELNGEKGYSDYVAWWQQAFAFNTPDYVKMLSTFYPLPRICSDEDIDYIYQLFRDRPGIPQMMLAKSLDRVRAERPTLYEKLAQLNQR